MATRGRLAPVRGPDRSATSSHRVRAGCARPSLQGSEDPSGSRTTESRTRPSGRPLRASRWQDDSQKRDVKKNFVIIKVQSLKEAIPFILNYCYNVSQGNIMFDVKHSVWGQV